MHPAPAAPRRRRGLILAGLLLLVAALAYGWSARTPATSDAPNYRLAQVDRGTVRVAIAATGSLRARSTVDIGSQLSGQLAEVLVDFNQRVVRDQVLARLDPAAQQARVTIAEADLQSARAQLEEATVAWQTATREAERRQTLAAQGLIARTDAEAAAAERDAGATRVTSARARVAEREASLSNARLDLKRTDIRSPVDGVVLLRQAEPGQTVAASFQTPVLFRIAEDLAQMQIDLAVDESHVGQIEPGMLVRFTVDTYRERPFLGTVEQVRLAAVNQQNVITYPVVVGVENADLKLLPGMTASAEIEVSVRENVLRIPNAALRFKPPAALRPARTETRDGLLKGLTLSAEQRAAYEADRQQMDQLSANERSQLSEQGLLPPGQRGQAMVIRLDAASAASPQAIQQAIAQRMRERFAGFRATLDEAQRAQFDARLATLGASAGDARPAPGGAEVWQPTDDGPRPRAVQIGVADSTHTELRDQRLREGDTVIVGVQRG